MNFSLPITPASTSSGNQARWYQNRKTNGCTNDTLLIIHSGKAKAEAKNDTHYNEISQFDISSDKALSESPKVFIYWLVIIVLSAFVIFYVVRHHIDKA